MWERGLKHPRKEQSTFCYMVAPHVGAWVETGNSICAVMSSRVAPHVGAWVETLGFGHVYPVYCVAPHVGAWVETSQA